MTKINENGAAKGIAVPDISEAELQFGTTRGLPALKEIPPEFKRHNGTVWNRFVSDLFFKGVKKIDVTHAAGIDSKSAMRHVRAILASWEPSHEHKEAGAAYLLSQYFSSITWEAA